MKKLEEYIREDHKFLVKSKAKEIKYKYFPKDKDELCVIIRERMKEEGPNCDLNDIDVSNITTMEYLFGTAPCCSFTGDISQWDVSNVTNMTNMFRGSDFNGDISQWDVSNVKYMRTMFYSSAFNGDISDWDVSNVYDMKGIFLHCPLENNPPKWYRK